MSLINKMLKDLERRPQAEATSILADLKWGVTHELKDNKKYYFIITFLVFILLLGFILLFSAHTRTKFTSVGINTRGYSKKNYTD